MKCNLNIKLIKIKREYVKKIVYNYELNLFIFALELKCVPLIFYYKK